MSVSQWTHLLTVFLCNTQSRLFVAVIFSNKSGSKHIRTLWSINAHELRWKLIYRINSSMSIKEKKSHVTLPQQFMRLDNCLGKVRTAAGESMFRRFCSLEHTRRKRWFIRKCFMPRSNFFAKVEFPWNGNTARVSRFLTALEQVSFWSSVVKRCALKARLSNLSWKTLRFVCAGLVPGLWKSRKGQNKSSLLRHALWLRRVFEEGK